MSFLRDAVPEMKGWIFFMIFYKRACRRIRVMMLFSAVCTVSCMYSQIHDELVLRAAFDFGSGAIKMQVAFVDLREKHIVGKPLLSKQVSLSLTEDIAMHGNTISPGMQRQAMDVLKSLKNEAKSASGIYESELAYAGVATAVFRKASNGGDVLKVFEHELNIHFYILPQDDEGKLGFMTARALFPDRDEENLLAWDNGNASLQITGRIGQEYHVYQAPTGHGALRVLLSQDIRKGSVLQSHESGNPVLTHESQQLDKEIIQLLPPVPGWLQKKLISGAMVVTFGEGLSLFAVMVQSKAQGEGIHDTVEEAVLTYVDLQKMKEFYEGQGDDFFDSHGVYRRTLTGALYLLAVMRVLAIDAFHYKKSLGNTAGILVSCEFWRN